MKLNPFFLWFEVFLFYLKKHMQQITKARCLQWRNRFLNYFLFYFEFFFFFILFWQFTLCTCATLLLRRSKCNFYLFQGNSWSPIYPAAAGRHCLYIVCWQNVVVSSTQLTEWAEPAAFSFNIANNKRFLFLTAPNQTALLQACMHFLSNKNMLLTFSPFSFQ